MHDDLLSACLREPDFPVARAGCTPVVLSSTAATGPALP